MRTVIDVIIDIVDRNAYSLNSSLRLQGNNIVQANGVPFEDYVMNLFSDNLFETNVKNYRKKIDETFSCLHANNYSPDYIIKGGDAIEVKKTEKIATEYQFNSSYPKNKLFADSPKLLPGALKNENWTEKDMLYVFGVVPEGKRLSFMSFVYGSEFAANRKFYENVENKIREAVTGEESVTTNELGRLNGVDPLQFTSLRVRGMWLVKNPLNQISNLVDFDNKRSFNFVALMDCKKFNLDPHKATLENIAKQNPALKIQDIQIADPDTLVSKKSKLITYYVR